MNFLGSCYSKTNGTPKQIKGGTHYELRNCPKMLKTSHTFISLSLEAINTPPSLAPRFFTNTS